ncbi:MAG: TRAP transporter substrate-binding protein DctP [Ectothiorhodospiraceae bacterium]|nr:TRAP transporter substrate-binding protein DctP [Ectothiorhodospiraceae bacterium]
MKPIRKLLSCVSVAAVAVAMVFALIPLGASASDVTRWRVQTHWPQASSSYNDSLVFLKERLEERTDGRLILELYEAGSLVPTSDIFDATRRGVVQMGTISPAYVLDRSELAGIAFGLPNAFRDVWEAIYFWQILGFEDMLREDFARYGVYWSTDKVYATEMVVKEPIESLRDFEALNIRSSGTLQRFLTDAGAAASMIPGEELYQALSTGVVDGAHWGAAQGAYSMSLYEIAKYHVRPPLNLGGIDVFIINQDAMDNLPDDVREILVQTLKEQFYYRSIEYQYKEEITLARAQQELGVEVTMLPDDVLAAMNEAAAKIWDNERNKGELAAEAMDRLEGFLRELGYID